MSLANLVRMPALGETSHEPVPAAPPATIAETGLHPDSLAQLLLKTLLNGEATGASLAERMHVPYSLLDALVQHARIEKLLEVRGTTGYIRDAN